VGGIVPRRSGQRVSGGGREDCGVTQAGANRGQFADLNVHDRMFGRGYVAPSVKLSLPQ
jgi:hypothetical protein